MGGLSRLCATIVFLCASLDVVNSFVSPAFPSFSHAYKPHGTDLRSAVSLALDFPNATDIKPPDIVKVNKSVYEHQVSTKPSDLSVQEKYPVIYRWHNRLAAVLGRQTEHWHQDWKIWVGLAFFGSMWAKWLIYGKDEIWWQYAFFAFGLNIIILHVLQYAPEVKVGMVNVCFLLAAQSFVLNYLAFNDKKKKRSHKKGRSFTKSPRLHEKKFLADSLYLDLSLPPYQIGVLFIAQVCVWWFYMMSIVANFDFAYVNYAFWLVAFLSMQMTMILCRGGDSVLGNPFPVRDVYHLVTLCDKMVFEEEGAEYDEPFKISSSDVFVRGLAGFFSNAILREIMCYTIPLMLMGFSEPMDFVVYCVGVNFICTIDDMSNKTFVMRAEGDAEIPQLSPHSLTHSPQLSPH